MRKKSTPCFLSSLNPLETANPNSTSKVPPIHITEEKIPLALITNSLVGETLVATIQGMARAINTFCTLDPRAFAIAMALRPSCAIRTEAQKLGNDVPTAQTVMPSTPVEIPKEACNASAAAHIRYEKTPNHIMDNVKAQYHRWAFSGCLGSHQSIVICRAISTGKHRTWDNRLVHGTSLSTKVSSSRAAKSTHNDWRCPLVWLRIAARYPCFSSSEAAST
mmetsp:Transcript_25799/g.56914  ORF Transcript_25799/g.56914 Transcript_25799/m.56914 type:complete len:221 (-) Transcript_25799:1080-1742(-)